MTLKGCGYWVSNFLGFYYRMGMKFKALFLSCSVPCVPKALVPSEPLVPRKSGESYVELLRHYAHSFLA